MLVREYLGSAAELFNLPKAEAIDRIDSLLNLFALKDSGRQSLFSLSSGQRKKVGLCVALLPDRELLLLDEPFSGGLDPAGIAALQRVLTHRARHHGQTIVMTTPVAEIVSELADRLLILKSGELTGNFSRSELKQHCQDEVISASTLNALIFPDVAARIDQYLSQSAGQFSSSGSSQSGAL
jgi:ABC-type multidrug transport system ATPase subunit